MKKVMVCFEGVARGVGGVLGQARLGVGSGTVKENYC